MRLLTNLWKKLVERKFRSTQLAAKLVAQEVFDLCEDESLLISDESRARVLYLLVARREDIRCRGTGMTANPYSVLLSYQSLLQESRESVKLLRAEHTVNSSLTQRFMSQGTYRDGILSRYSLEQIRGWNAAEDRREFYAGLAAN